MSPNPNYFGKKTSYSTDQLLKNIFQQRILHDKNQNDDLDPQEDRLLTGNKVSNPNLFLSSIKYKQEGTKMGNKKMRTLKNINKVWLKPESEQDESFFQ